MKTEHNISRLVVLLLTTIFFLPLYAESETQYLTSRNELRVGWGDQLFESMRWHNPTFIARSMPETNQYTYKENYHYDQHLWLEYQWRFASWFAFGGMMDVSNVRWDNVTRNGKGDITAVEKGQHFYNILRMPTLRFTYFFHENVNLYSGLGLGLGINGGSETNLKGQHTDWGYALDLTVIGMSVNYKRLFFSVDAGGVYSFKDKNTIYLLSSRIVSASIGVRF